MALSRTMLSRREFGTIVTAGAAGALGATSRRDTAAAGQNAAVTAQQIIDRIKQQIGVDWRTDTVDTVKAGDPSTVVTGIATTAMATLGVLQAAANAGANFVITSEPTFYGRADARNSRPDLPPDPVLTAKNAFVNGRHLIVFRLSDHWRLRTPNPLVQGLAAVLGWTGRTAAGDASRYEIPAIPLVGLATDVNSKLRARGGLRVVGNPQTSVRTVALLPGSTPIAAALQALPAADVLIAGEVREWESVEYARDVSFSGRAKGLILAGRVVSEEPGMAACAEWLEALVPEVPVRHIAAGDPYWRPAS